MEKGNKQYNLDFEGQPEKKEIEIHKQDECVACGNMFESVGSCVQCRNNKSKQKWLKVNQGWRGKSGKKMASENEKPELIKPDDEGCPEIPVVGPGAREIHEIPGTEIEKRKPALPQKEIRKIINEIEEDEEGDREHEDKVNEIIKKRDEEKRKNQ